RAIALALRGPPWALIERPYSYWSAIPSHISSKCGCDKSCGTDQFLLLPGKRAGPRVNNHCHGSGYVGVDMPNADVLIVEREFFRSITEHRSPLELLHFVV